MITQLLVGWLLAVGPHLDPIDGQSVGELERTLLPSAQHLSDAADLWFVPAMNQQLSGSGGIEALDPVQLSYYGVGQPWMAFHVGALDISDPARPGEPLLQLPFYAWQRLQLDGLWTDLPGWTWQLDDAAVDHAGGRVIGRWGRDVGGGVWFPHHVFDRDPSFVDGSPTARRALRSAVEVTAQAQAPLPWGDVRVTLEGLAHDHVYLTLGPTDAAERLVVLATTRGRGVVPWDVSAAWHGQRRPFEGAQYRWPEAVTQDSASQAAVLQANAAVPMGEAGRLALSLGGGWRTDRATLHSPSPVVIDVEDQWLWSARPPLGDAFTQRWRLDAVALWEPGEELPLQVRARGGVQQVRGGPQVNGDQSATAWHGVPVSQTTWSNPGGSVETLQQARLEAQFNPQWDGLQLQAILAADYAGVSALTSPAINLWSPAAGMAARLQRPWGEVFALARREPLALHAQVAEYLDQRRPSGMTHQWTEDNAAPSANTFLNSTGPAYHDIAAALARPTADHLAIGYKTPLWGAFRLVVQGIGRWTRQRLTIRQPYAASYAVPFSSGDSPVTAVYAQPPGGAPARFLLTNDPATSFFVGTELQIRTEDTTWWFVNLAGAAYVSAGNAPFGSFPDRNDPGVLNEASAGLNNSINAWGRYDHDRSFSLKLLAGITPIEGLSFAIAARYRDGQPFTRIAVAELPQGPTAIMAYPRGHVRYTFHMNWDVRARYSWQMGPLQAALVLDVFNLWGSATELLEDPRTGPTWRRSLEAVPDRAVKLSFELGGDGGDG